MKCYLPPGLLQLIERMQGVILGGPGAQDLMVLLGSCQSTLCTAVHHLVECREGSTLGSGHGGRRRRPSGRSPPLTASLL